MEEEQIKHMVSKFLGWKLPEDFHPDAGIEYHENLLAPQPIGTNLFTATQAEAMVRHMLQDLPRGKES
jgi:hypothetical protein